MIFRDFESNGYSFRIGVDGLDVSIASMPSLRDFSQGGLTAYRAALFALSVEMSRIEMEVWREKHKAKVD